MEASEAGQVSSLVDRVVEFWHSPVRCGKAGEEFRASDLRQERKGV